MCRLVEPVADDLERGGVDADGLGRVGRVPAEDDRCLAVRGGRLDLRDDVRRHELAAVRDHRVEARHLERRHRDVLLPDRELDRSRPGSTRGPSRSRSAACARQGSGRGRSAPRPGRSPWAGRTRTSAPSPASASGPCRPGGRSRSPAGRSTCRTTRASASGSVIAWLTYGSQFLNTCLSSPYVALGRALERLVGLEQVLLHRGEGGDRLPGRAGRVDAARGAVDARVVRLLRGVVVDERLDLLRVDPPDVHRRLVRRRGRHREHRAVERVERDERAAVRVVRPVRLGGLDPEAEGALRRALEADVDRQAHRAPGTRLELGLERATRAAERVDPDLGLAGLAAQVLVVLRLHPGLPDLVARRVHLRARVELLLGDLAHVAEHLRREGLVRVVAQIGLLDLHAREVGLVLVAGTRSGPRRRRSSR